MNYSVYLSDLIDLSNDYEISRSDENIRVKLLTEIQGRLEEKELEIDVQFEPNTLGIEISKMENERPETKRISNPGPRRAAP